MRPAPTRPPPRAVSPNTTPLRKIGAQFGSRKGLQPLVLGVRLIVGRESRVWGAGDRRKRPGFNDTVLQLPIPIAIEKIIATIQRETCGDDPKTIYWSVLSNDLEDLTR